MLASTVQFSTYNRPPTHRPRRTPLSHRRTSGTRTGRPRHKETTPTRATPGGPAPSGPNSVPTTSSHSHHPVPHATRGNAVLGAAAAAGRTGQRSTLEHHPRSFAVHHSWCTVMSWARLWTTTHVWRPVLLKKVVIQPHLPVRLPCYDFVPIADPAFDGSLPQGVGPPASGVTDFRDVTGGVYKARERIHRSVADLRLLATPTSWGRVADPNPN